MKSGPRPKPTALKIIRGNPGNRKLNHREPKPQGDLKEAPAHFDAKRKEVWDYAIEHAPRGLLKMLDGSTLEVWCDAHVRHREAVEKVNKFGMIMKAPNTGLPIQSPYLPIVNKQALIMLRAVDHLGFSPAARCRIMMAEEASGEDNWTAIEALTS